MTPDRRVPDDDQLPQLARLFDVEAMSRHIESAWTPQGHAEPSESAGRVLSCEIERVKYRPGRNCVVGYRVRMRLPRERAAFDGSLQPRPARIATRRICAAMYPLAEAEQRYARARQRAAHEDRVALLPDHGLLLWQFPVDRKLAALPRLADPRWLRSSRLPQLVEARWGLGWQIEGVRSRLVSYFPDHAATLQARLHLADVAAGRRRIWNVFGKVRYDDSGTRIFDAMRRLCDSAACVAGDVGYARPIAVDAADRILWQDGVDAPTLDAVLDDQGGSASLWQRVTRAVAALHASDLDLPVVTTRESLLAEIGRARDVLARAVPQESTRVRELADRLIAAAAEFGMAADATLHGDLHSKNLLIGADRVFIIDLDRIGRGPALADLGSLLAETVLRDCLAANAVDEARLEAIARGYAAASGRAIDGRELRWQLAAALLRERAYRCVTSLKPGRIEALPAVLAAASAALSGRGFEASP